MRILYGVVINNAVSPAAFVRLAWVCVINGALISLLAFAQRLSSSDHMIYWSIVVGGHAYGPFDYRNVFPFFANVCIGLGLGLLASVAQKKGRAILQNARAIWLFTAAAVTITAVVFSFSRGGLLALIIALVLGGVLWWRRGQDRSSAGMLLWLAPVVLIAGSAIGWTALESRYENLANDRSVTADRYGVWQDSLRQLPSFPIFGSGNGSFPIVEPMTRTNVQNVFTLFEHAHNEYVEALVEGGLARLGLTLALIWTVTAAGIRNYRHYAGRTHGWLVLGGLIGFWAVALHSFVDFGVHYPAVAMLGTVLMAHIVAGRQRDTASDRVHLPLPVCLAMALCMVVLGGLLVRESFWEDRATRFRNAALLLTRDEASKDTALRVKYLEAAIACRPDNFRYHNELSHAWSDFSNEADDPDEKDRRIRECLRHAREARDLAPAFVRPHGWLGMYGDHFQSPTAQSAIWYFERARRSAPTDPEIRYVCGKQLFDDGYLADAWSEWRQTLVISDGFIEPIWREAQDTNSPPLEFLDKVVPETAEKIRVAADTLFPSNVRVADEPRRTFLLKALHGIDRREGNRTAAEDYFRSQLLRELGRSDDCIAALRRALQKDPDMLDCRHLLVDELYDRKEFQEAKQEVEFILLHNSQDRYWQDYLLAIEREILIQEP